MWHETPRVDTPKCGRADGETSTDTDLQGRPPKRRASVKSDSDTDLDAPSDPPRPAVSVTATQEIAPFPAPQIATPYGAAPQTQPQVHYSLSEIVKNPLRRYPSSKSLYGLDPDGSLLRHPVFAVNFGGCGARKLLRGVKMTRQCVY